jgi:hypothetical protein
MTGLARAAWRTYTHGGGFSEVDEINTVAWSLAEERRSFADVPQVLADPGDPRLQPYSPLLWHAEQIGHLLEQVGDPRIALAVSREVEIELKAVSRAELGDRRPWCRRRRRRARRHRQSPIGTPGPPRRTRPRRPVCRPPAPAGHLERWRGAVSSQASWTSGEWVCSPGSTAPRPRDVELLSQATARGWREWVKLGEPSLITLLAEGCVCPESCPAASL